MIPAAVVGVGQTHHKSRRRDVSFGGLVREAVFRALDDAHMTMADIDAVVLGKAPDLFEGVMKPELYLSDALGAVGKPMFRVHTAGSVGGTTGVVAASHVQAGKHKTVLAVAFEKQSEGNAQFALGSGKGASLGAGGSFAPFIRAYIHRSGAPEHIGWKVAVKDRLNALKNPYAHLKIEDISIEKVKDSPMMWDPIRYLESCPSSDGACAVVITDEDGGKAAAADGRPPAWILGDVVAQRAAQLPGPRPGATRRRACSAPTTSTSRPASPTPASRSTWPSCTCRSRGTSRSGSRPTTSPTRATGWKMIDDGTTEITGSFPINCSGGVLSTNPIGASGLLRFAEAANQVRGRAGEHQVDGADVALGHGLRRAEPVLLHVGRRQQPPAVRLRRSTDRESTMRLHDIVEYHARDRPGAVALRDGDQAMTYRDLDGLAESFADALASSGLVAGDRFAVLSANCLEYFAWYFGAAKVGAVTVPLNPRLAPPEWAYVVNDSRCRLLVARNDLVGAIDEVRSGAAHGRRLRGDGSTPGRLGGVDILARRRPGPHPEPGVCSARGPGGPDVHQRYDGPAQGGDPLAGLVDLLDHPAPGLDRRPGIGLHPRRRAPVARGLHHGRHGQPARRWQRLRSGGLRPSGSGPHPR